MDVQWCISNSQRNNKHGIIGAHYYCLPVEQSLQVLALRLLCHRTVNCGQRVDYRPLPRDCAAFWTSGPITVWPEQ